MEDELRLLSSFTVMHTEVQSSNNICLLMSIEKDHSHTV